MPGEVSYLVMDADGIELSETSGTVGEVLAERRKSQQISTSITAADDNWIDALLESVIRAALDEPVAEEGSEVSE